MEMIEMPYCHIAGGALSTMLGSVARGSTCYSLFLRPGTGNLIKSHSWGLNRTETFPTV